MQELDSKIREAFDKTRWTYRREIDTLMGNFGYSVEDILGAWKAWDVPESVHNSDYNNSLIRLTMHLHNRHPNLWHQKRQKKVLEYINNFMPKSICEIGFGTPQLYVEKYSLPTNTRTLLCDLDTDDFSFSRNILSYWTGNQGSSVSFQQYDMNKDPLPQGFDCYVFQDSIEHAHNPTETLETYVHQVPDGTRFVFSLPLEIENPIPQHHICWTSEEGIRAWIQEGGLRIDASDTIIMGEEDIFARNLHPDFREILFSCIK